MPHLLEEWDDPRDPKEVSYGDNRTVINWKCKNGHKYPAVPHSRYRGRGCPVCNGRVLGAGSRTLENTYPIIAQEISPISGIKASELAPSSGKKVDFVCPDCNKVYLAKIHDRTSKGSGCPSCALSHTKLEKYTEGLLGQIKYDKYIFGARSPLPYRPDIKLSDTVYLNSDGLYRHAEPSRDRQYHIKMRENFEKHGLRLLQFYEDEIYQKPEIIKSMVNAILGGINVKLMARKCKMIVVESDVAQVFLRNNHLIGENRRSRFVGLTYNGELVSVMGYRIHDDHIEIVRSSSLLNTVVRGSFQKLISELQRHHSDLKIRTLVDLRYAKGHSLIVAGFKHIKTSLGYQYTNGKIRKDKRKFRVPAGVNEREEAAKKGWYRIYDAGKAVYELAPLAKN